MNTNLQHTIISKFITASGSVFRNLKLSYQLFGLPLGENPIVLINHALTGNSNVSGIDGWWNNLVGSNKGIDTRKFTIIAFNIPGNGFDKTVFENYKNFTCKDIANLFLIGLNVLKIEQLFAIIGGSLGGGIAWEMAALQPLLTKHLIPIATHHVASDWIIANCLIQEQLLLNSSQPIHDARLHAMLCYRTPVSFQSRFKRTINENLGIFNIESWLLHHGKKLQERFQCASYKLMNHLLRTINVEKLDTIEAQITLIAIDSDMFFTSDDIKESYNTLQKLNKNVSYHEIKSIHGHDAFLIEYNQLSKIIAPILKINKNHNHYYNNTKL